MLNCWCITWPVGFKMLIFIQLSIFPSSILAPFYATVANLYTENIDRGPPSHRKFSTLFTQLKCVISQNILRTALIRMYGHLHLYEVSKLNISWSFLLFLNILWTNIYIPCTRRISHSIIHRKETERNKYYIYNTVLWFCHLLPCFPPYVEKRPTVFHLAPSDLSPRCSRYLVHFLR